MERTLISWNFPNMVTVPLMAAVGFIVFAVVWQLAQRAIPALAGGNAPDNQGGF